MLKRNFDDVIPQQSLNRFRTAVKIELVCTKELLQNDWLSVGFRELDYALMSWSPLPCDPNGTIEESAFFDVKQFHHVAVARGDNRAVD